MKASGRNSASRWAAATRMLSTRLTVLPIRTTPSTSGTSARTSTWQQFGLGVVYTTDNGALEHDGQNRTWVAGIDYTTGPFKLGGSYLNNHEGLGDETAPDGISNGTLDTQRWAPGVIYTYGPGMTFRGSVGWVRTTLPDEGGNAGDRRPRQLHRRSARHANQLLILPDWIKNQGCGFPHPFFFDDIDP